MNPVSGTATGWATQGLAELGRKFARAVERVRLFLDRRKVRQAEIALGELGWMQVEFPPEIQAEVDGIKRSERDQAALANTAAEEAAKINELSKRIEEIEQEKKRTVEELEAKAAPDRQASSETKRELDACASRLRELESALPKFERQLRQTGADSEPTLSFEQRMSAERAFEEFHREQSLLQAKAAQLNAGLRRYEGTIAEQEAVIASAKETADTRLRENRSELRRLEREKAALEKGMQTLEGGKERFYLPIGRCLADAQIAPMNQPQALDTVLRLRASAAEREANLETSMAASAAADRQALMKFYAIAGGLLLLLVLLALFLANARG